MKLDEELKEALILKYQGEIAVSKANIKVYLTSPVGIGEHPDIIAAIDSEIEKAAHADEKLSFLSNEFGEEW